MKNSKSRIALAAAVLLFGGVSSQAVPVLGPTGNYYEVIVSPHVSWDDAQNAATAAGGYLATSTSATENAFLASLIVDLGQFWLGGYQNPITETDPQAGWTWVNGEGSFPGDNFGPAYANWESSEPNDAGGPGSEQYLTIGRFSEDPGAWNDEGSVNWISGYIVEYTSVPEGGSIFALFFFSVAALGLVRRKLS